jgi:osmotically-inducible protein OsmY
MIRNRGKQLGLLAGIGVGASLFLTERRVSRKRDQEVLDVLPDTNHALAALVCAELDQKVEHGKGIQVFADRKRVTLRGHALADELDDVLKTVLGIDHVQGVSNQLEVRDSPGNVLALQA